MTREDRLEFCSACTKRGFDPKQGIICGLTKEQATFNGNCPDYNEDERVKYHEGLKKEANKYESKKSINRGRYALFIIGGLYLVIGYIEAIVQGYGMIVGAIDWGIAAVFIGLGIWSLKEAFTPLIIGAIIYGLLVILLAIVEPTTLIRGIIWKVIIIGSFAVSINEANEQRKHRKPEKQDDLLDDF